MKKIAFITKKRNDAVRVVEENLLKEFKKKNYQTFKIDTITFPYSNFFLSFLYLFKNIFIIINIYKEYDIIHYSSFDIYIILFQPVLKRIYRKKTILTVYHLEIDFVNSILNTLGLYEAIIKSFDTYICISEYSKNQLIDFKIDKSKIFVARLGVDKDHFYPDRDKSIDFNYILFVGDEYERKNLSTLLNALKIIFKKHENLKFVKIGVVKNNSHQMKTDKLVASLNLYDRIVFMRNKISPSNLRKYYSNAQFLVSPSTLEGFGLPVVEAMRCRCIPLVSNISAYREFNLPSSLYIENPLSVNQWVKKINVLLSLKKTQKEKLQKRAYEISLDYSWSKMAKQIKSIYEQNI